MVATDEQSHQQWIRVPFSPCPRQHVFCVYFIIIFDKAIPTGVRENLNGVLILTSLMAKEVEQFPPRLLAIHDAVLEKDTLRSLLRSFTYLWIGLPILLLLAFWSTLHLLNVNLCQMSSWQSLPPIL